MKICFLQFMVLVLFPFAAASTFAQTKAQQEVLKIRNEYQETEKRVQICETAEDEPCGLYLNTITENIRREPWAAVGIYTSKSDFWYESAENDEEDPYLLLKINIETKRSARTEIEELLFDVSGKLRFYYFHLTGDGNEANAQEFRFYFKDNVLMDYAEKVGAAELEFQYFTKEAWPQVLKNAKLYIEQFQLMTARY